MMGGDVYAQNYHYINYPDIHICINRCYISSNARIEIYDDAIVDAVKQFQANKNLPDTGMMDDETLTQLLWGISVNELDELYPMLNPNSMWIPTDGGKRRHCDPLCCDMYDPRLISIRNADVIGMYPCKRCTE